VIEACGSASYWARELIKLGHEVRLIAPQYVRPFVKRQNNDAADAEAIVVAAQRPEMRFVQPKSEDQQACAVLFRARERLLHQRTELVNALRSVLYEYGHVVPKGMRTRLSLSLRLGLQVTHSRRCPVTAAVRACLQVRRIEKVRPTWKRSPTDKFC
jgi:transposase